MSLVFAVSLKIIDNLICNTAPLLKARQLPSQTEIELTRLQENLPKVKKVLAFVENNNHIVVENEGLEAWIWQFRDAVDAAEDVLDELEYYEIEERVHSRHDKVRGSLSTYKRKLVKFINGACNDDSMKKLAETVKGLEKVAADVDIFLKLAIGLHDDDANHEQQWKLSNARETGSLLTENKVFGRNKEKNDLVDWLTTLESETAEEAGYMSALTIVGIGGIGKTTLAQLAYDDVRVKKSFDIMMWVCVSNNFDLGVVTRKFLEAANEQCPSTDNLEELQNILRNKLESKKFFVVLDDVWDDDDDKRVEWEKLFTPFKCGKKGSKIVVTSRMGSVAEMIADMTNGKKECLELKGLEEDDYLLLFNKHAFAGVDPEDHKHLQLIGEQIAQKLGGCPLIAKVLGAQLNSYLDEYYWEKILKENIFQVRNCTDDISRILQLSYSHLSSNLQYCFRYCSIFPQDYEFQKNELVLMWIGSGIILYDQRGPENIAEEYFNELVRKSFLDFKEEQLYVMHDLLHDLARYVSINECLRIEYNLRGTVPKTVRHLYVNEINNDKILREVSHLKNLRTLILVLRGEKAKKNQLPTIHEIFKNIKNLRLFSMIANFSYKLPDEISSQIHLRYLSLEQSSVDNLELSWFPETVYSLYHLRVMKFSDQAHVNLKGIKLNGMSSLVNLRHMLIPSKIMVKIPCIGKLTSLQSSLIFKIGEKDGHTIHELKHLSGICELSLWNVEKIRNPYEAKEANFMKKTNLKGLLLNWTEDHSRESKVDEELINKLEPKIGLSEVSIIGYNGNRSPFWMVKNYYSNLITISFLGCPNWEQLPPLGHLPFLEKLLLVDMSSVRTIDQSFYGVRHGPHFPSLKDLKFKNMKIWVKWDEIDDWQAFPQLRYLTIEHCPDLKSIPTLPFTLTELCFEDVGIVKFPKFYQGTLGGVRDQVTSLTSSASSSQSQLELSLQKIRIKNCLNLEHISLDFFRNLSVVESMDIMECPELLTDETGDGLLPSTMVFLNLRSCGTLDVLLLGSMLHLTSLMILVLEGCANIVSLPGREVFTQLKSLDIVAILNCVNLVSLGGIDAVESLGELKISGCDKLVPYSFSVPKVESNPSKIKDLIIDCDSLLLVNPLRSLSSVETLKVGRICAPFPEQWLLQNSYSLERIEIYDSSPLHYLPESMVRFTSLWRLQICKARNIESLKNLPTSLEELHICGCNHTPKTQLLSSLSKDLCFPYEEDIEIIEEECGDQLFQPQNHKIASDEEETDGTGEDDTSEEEDGENSETARILDDSSLVVAPSSSSASVSM